ncbi:MAG: TetR/AcrR family transcriptional regulator [Acetatifactor sp.]
MVNKTTTKERILDSALTLFAEKGYDGVGVDLIAEKSGLKGPSLYKHFKGKEEILDTLISQVENYYERNFGSEIHPGRIPASMDELIDISLKRIQFTLHDERIKKTRRILTKEQFRNPRIARLATRYNLENIQGIYQKIFQGMMDAGVMRRENPAMLSMSFTAPITLLIQMCDREPEREQEIMELMNEYLKHFSEEYAV